MRAGSVCECVSQKGITVNVRKYEPQSLVNDRTDTQQKNNFKKLVGQRKEVNAKKSRGNNTLKNVSIAAF